MTAAAPGNHSYPTDGVNESRRIHTLGRRMRSALALVAVLAMSTCMAAGCAHPRRADSPQSASTSSETTTPDGSHASAVQIASDSSDFAGKVRQTRIGDCVSHWGADSIPWNKFQVMGCNYALATDRVVDIVSSTELCTTTKSISTAEYSSEQPVVALCVTSLNDN